MRADMIIKNAKIFTADKDNPQAAALVVKDADFLVFDNNLLEAEQEGFSHNMPKEVYITGKKVN
ncbi:hypothetical protein SAMN05216349_10447 [Oribacterium sp. KHPX15]|nr:hypothetical protein SAMN05216349_10447 [Oribacterium sp. KHPX15]